MEQQEARQQVVQQIPRMPIHFGGTMFFSDSLANLLIGFSIIEDAYDAKGERELPFVNLYFVGLSDPVQLEGEDFEAFKKWWKKADRSTERLERPALVQP